MSARRRLRATEPVEPAPRPAAEPPQPAEPAAPERFREPAASAEAAVANDNGASGVIEPPIEVPVEGQRDPVAVPLEPALAPAETIAAPPARSHRVATFFTLIAFALVAFVTGIVVFNNLVMPRLIHGIGQVRVPDLTHFTLEQAEQTLRTLNLQLSRAGERFDPALPRGYILSQDPPAGTAVRGNRRVSVMVSLGEEFSSVPALFGESQRSAEHLLKSAGLRLGSITRAPSEEVGDGLVAGSDPGPETVLPRDAPVHLLISTGAGEESFVMPDVLGRELSGVRRRLEAHGFRVDTPPGGSVGTIVSQQPAAGARITRGTEIRLQGVGRVIR
jgi:beta-lactam-binding protein with PASTA domain